MRDLSKQNLFSNNKTRSGNGRWFAQNKRLVMVILGLVALFVVGYFVFNRGGSTDGGAITNGAVTLKDAPTNLAPVPLSGTAVSGGVDLATQTARMNDVKFGGDATATVTRAYGGGVYKLNVTANLPDPKSTYYEVWLVGSNGPIPIDFMSGSKNSWSLSITDADKFSAYKGVLITLERTKDSLPEEHVMEGSF